MGLFDHVNPSPRIIADVQRWAARGGRLGESAQQVLKDEQERLAAAAQQAERARKAAHTRAMTADAAEQATFRTQVLTNEGPIPAPVTGNRAPAGSILGAISAFQHGAGLR
jgi:hypothetical protein